MSERIEWAPADADYIRTRADRYPGALGIEPQWAAEALADEMVAVIDRDPKSRVGATRFIGFSSSAGRVLTVIAYRDLAGVLHGVNAWPATGNDLALYEGRLS